MEKVKIGSDFEENTGNVGFFCMKLAGYILKHKADYWHEMRKAANGNCSYATMCPIYKRTVENEKLKNYGTH